MSTLDQRHRASLTLSPKFGPGLWLDGRFVARLGASVEDSRITPEEPEPRWYRDALVFVDAVNSAHGQRPPLNFARLSRLWDVDEDDLRSALGVGLVEDFGAEFRECLDAIDGIVDDTHPEGDGCPLCNELDALRIVVDRAFPAVPA